jgi:hypothetical protein
MKDKLQVWLIVFNLFCAVAFSIALILYVRQLQSVFGVNPFSLYQLREMFEFSAVSGSVYPNEFNYFNPVRLLVPILPLIFEIVAFTVGVGFSGQRTKAARLFQTILIGFGFLSRLTVVPSVVLLVYWVSTEVVQLYKTKAQA